MAESYEFLDVVDASPEAMYELFEERGWGDGLPLVPPTSARVDAMLEGCGGDPDEVLAVLPPRFGKATRRMVAVNAALAGCKPEYMPVLVAATRALGEKKLNLRGVNATTHPVAPLLIVHGEIAERRLQQRPRRVRSGQPSQRHDGTRAAPDLVAHRRRGARPG